LQQKIRGNAEKRPLTASPFVVKFEFGVANEGYWCYEGMVLQLENCMDGLHTLYPQFYVILLSGHSCGHNKQKKMLTTENMTMNYGGKQCLSRPFLRKEERDYLGPMYTYCMLVTPNT